MAATYFEPAREVRALPVSNSQIVLYGVLATVTMLFAAFASAYMVRQGSGGWQPVALPGVLWLNTLLLAGSSATIELARRQSRTVGGTDGLANRARLDAAPTRWLIGSNLLAFAFLAGQLLSWQQLAAAGIYLPTNPHASFFYIMTGLHGLHLLGGLVLLAVAWITRRETTMSCAATYWHFLGLVWLGVLALLKYA
ncbi:MAG: putative cytochrome c oxidase subunit 3 [Verrucomicrobiae bacterium]|nr:putative cytochrome c oxidase subunit 3 [Verrucomicrobiae bacterium]